MVEKNVTQFRKREIEGGLAMRLCSKCHGEGNHACDICGGRGCPDCFYVGQVTCECVKVQLPPGKKLEKFRNPTRAFTHLGGYRVLVAAGTVTTNLPDGAVRVGNVVSVQDGIVTQSMGAIQFCTHPSRRRPSFSLPYDQIVKITRKRGNRPIWVNENYPHDSGYIVVK